MHLKERTKKLGFNDITADHDRAYVVDCESPAIRVADYTFYCLSKTFCQVISDDRPSFAQIPTPLTLEVTSKAELCQVLEYYCASLQCAKTLFF